MANATRAGVNRKSKGDELSTALASEDGQHWIAALKVELESLLQTTKSIVPETPEPGMEYDMIYATTALKKKLHADGSVDKYKVRIPVCGNQLKSKWDYNNDTYSPTVSMLTHTALLQLAVHDKMSMATFDTLAAYLHQLYPEVISSQEVFIWSPWCGPCLLSRIFGGPGEEWILQVHI